MNGILSVFITIIFIITIAYLVIKKYNSVFIFLTAGITVLMLFAIFTNVSILGDKTSGNTIIDVFLFVTGKFKSNASGVGLTLMMVTGYAIYMSHIGAATKLAYLATKPLSRIKNPYIVMSVMFIIGTFLKLVITSHAGLGMLLMAVTYPIFISLGISKLSASASIVLSGFIDWGPNDSSAIFAGEEVVKIPFIEYFINYQLKQSVALIIFLAIFIPIYFRYMDNKNKLDLDSNKINTEVEDVNCPSFYAILPIIPLLLVTIFSFIPSIKLDVTTANLIGIVFVFFIELIIKPNRKSTTNDFNVVMKAMGNSYANVVSILIGAAVFAEAIKLLRGITVISNALANTKGAPIISILLMTLITFLAGILLGSGNASWYAFGPLVPDVTTKLGMNAVQIALPMQISSGIGRCMSPVSAVMIAVSGMTEIDITDLIKRTTIPTLCVFIVNIIVSMFIA